MKVNAYRTSTLTLSRKTRGFTLMEVLITVVILSIGLLGIAGLQFNSLRTNKDAMNAAQAAVLAMEAAERIRANRPGVIDSNGNATQTDYDYIDSAGSDPGCISSGCTVENLALTDAYEWVSRVQALLPNGVGVICRDVSPYDGVGGSTSKAWDPQCNNDGKTGIFAIKVAWDHDRNPATVYQVYRMSLKP